MNRRVAINLSAFVAVFLVTLWWAVNNIVSFDFIERPYEIAGEFEATAGVARASEVAYLGVHYGSVSSVESIDGHVLVTMDIDRGKEIPAGSIARIFRKSAVGEPYIDFNPPEDYPGPGGPTIQPGEVVPLERTRVPLEFSEMLKSASRVLSSVDPSQTRTLVHELAIALEGRGAALKALTIDSDSLLATLAAKTDLLDRLSADSTRLTATIAAHRQSISSAVNDLADLAASLRAVDGDTQVLLDRGTELLHETADLVADVKPDLDCILTDLVPVTDALAAQRSLDLLGQILDLLPSGTANVRAAIDTEPGGPWARVVLITDPTNPVEQYVPLHELPEVPDVAACQSPLVARSSVRGTSTGPAAPFEGAATIPGGGSDRAAIAVFVLGGVVIALATRRRWS